MNAGGMIRKQAPLNVAVYDLTHRARRIVGVMNGSRLDSAEDGGMGWRESVYTILVQLPTTRSRLPTGLRAEMLPTGRRSGVDLSCRHSLACWSFLRLASCIQPMDERHRPVSVRGVSTILDRTHRPQKQIR